MREEDESTQAKAKAAHLPRKGEEDESTQAKAKAPRVENEKKRIDAEKLRIAREAER